MTASTRCFINDGLPFIEVVLSDLGNRFVTVITIIVTKPALIRFKVQHNECRNAKCICEMDCRIVDGNQKAHSANLGGKHVQHTVGTNRWVINDISAELGAAICNFLSAFAILQVDEGHAQRAQNRPLLIQRRTAPFTARWIGAAPRYFDYKLEALPGPQVLYRACKILASARAALR